MFGQHLFASRHPLSVVPMLLIMFVIATACGSNDDTGVDAEMDSASVSTGGAAAQPVADKAASSARDSAAIGATAAAGSAADGQQPSTNFDRLVIRTAQMDLAVDDVGSAVNAVRDLALARGGLVFSSNSYVEDEREYAQITIKVPADQFDSTMNELRSAPYVDEVVREESSSQDVSAEFVDNESRLSVLRETQSRFLALLEQAETVDDILRLEYELQSVRSEIEQIQGRQNYLENATELSTITVSLAPAGAPASPRASGGGFSVVEVFERAWENSRGAVEWLLVGTITLTIVAAFLLPIAAVAWFAYRFAKGRTARPSTGA